MARDPIHPGEHLGEELEEIGLGVGELAAEIGLPEARVVAFLSGREMLDADLALRLGKYFGTSPRFWMNLQSIHDLRVAETAIGHGLDAIRTRAAEPA